MEPNYIEGEHDVVFYCYRGEEYTSLSTCETKCSRYYSCDSVAAAIDRLKEMEGEDERIERVYELCPNCNNEQTVTRNFSCGHLEVHCPECNGKMMLCSMCPATEKGSGSCDWSENGCSKDISHKKVESGK